jgi:hypothetical protein
MKSSNTTVLKLVLLFLSLSDNLKFIFTQFLPITILFVFYRFRPFRGILARPHRLRRPQNATWRGTRSLLKRLVTASLQPRSTPLAVTRSLSRHLHGCSFLAAADNSSHWSTRRYSRLLPWTFQLPRAHTTTAVFFETTDSDVTTILWSPIKPLQPLPPRNIPFHERQRKRGAFPSHPHPTELSTELFRRHRAGRTSTYTVTHMHKPLYREPSIPSHPMNNSMTGDMYIGLV